MRTALALQYSHEACGNKIEVINEVLDETNQVVRSHI